MRTPLLFQLLILPTLLHQLCELATCLRMLGIVMKICLVYAFFGMLRQSNLAPSSAHFDPSCHICRGDIIVVPPPGHPYVGEVVQDCSNCQQVLSVTKPLLTVTKDRTVVVTFMLSQALKVLLETLQLDSDLYSLHSLRRAEPPPPRGQEWNNVT